MKTKFLTLIALIYMVAMIACDNGTKSTTEPEPETKPSTPQTLAPTTVSFVTLATSFPATTIDFSPSAALPTGVTYKLTDGTNTWNSASGFNGQVTNSGYSVGPVTFTQTFYLNGTEITGVNSKRIVHMTASPIGFAMNTGAGGDSGPVTLQYPNTPLTKNITVPAITTIANPMDFGAVSALTGWDADFPSEDVTYTVILSKDGSTTTTINSTNAITINASGLANGLHTATQTFYYKGNPIPNGSRSAGLVVSSNTFFFIVDLETNTQDGSFPALTLNLSK
jgi:hypothetical protein